MKYTLEQKLIAFGNDFSVYDEHGRQAFYFDSKVLAIGTKIIVSTPSNPQAAIIRRKFFSFRPTFTIKSNRMELARIYKKSFSFRKSFVIDVPGPLDITIVGQVLEHNYSFSRNGDIIAQVSKQWFKGKDTYSIEVRNDSDTLLVLSAAVVIDLMCHPKRDSGFGN